MAFQLGTNLDLGAQLPLDARSVVANQTERNELVTAGKAHAGLIVYVTGENKYYYYDVDNSWVEFGSSLNLVYTTGDQIISGIKNFMSRPTVNGTGVLLSGEVAQLPNTIVYTTGDQIISGIKNFMSRPTVNGTGVLLSGEVAQLPNTIVYTTGDQIISGIKSFNDALIRKKQIELFSTDLINYRLPLYRDNTLNSNTNFNFNFPTDDTNLQSILYVLRQPSGFGWGVNYNSIIWQNNNPGNPTLDKPRIFLIYRANETGTTAYGINLTEVASISQTVATTGNQTINGVKNFSSRPTINGTGVLLSGEVAQADLSSAVRITGDQTISGNKIFNNEIVTPVIKGYDDLRGSVRRIDLQNSVMYGSDIAITLNYFNRILSGQWVTNSRLLINNTGVILSGEAVSSNGTINKMVKLTQVEYDALSLKNPTTFYVIVG